MPATAITIPTEAIAAFCQKWQVTEFALFGSVLRPDFRPDSDIDILLSFVPDSRLTLFNLVTVQDELEAIFGRKVDVVQKAAIESSPNYIRRKSILKNPEVIYAAG